MNSQHWFNIVLLSRKYCNHLSKEEKAKKKTESTRCSCWKSTWTDHVEKEISLLLFSYLCKLFVERQFKWPTKENMYVIWLLKNYGRVNEGKPHFALQVDIRIMNRCHVETTRRNTCTNYRTRQIRFLCPSNSNTNDKHFTLGTKWRGEKTQTLVSWIVNYLTPPRLPSGIEITQTNTDIHLATALFFRQFELSEMLLLASKRRPAGLVPNGFVVLRWSSTMDNMFSALQ